MTAYYNEFDPGAAAWLRELIAQGLIADGIVDERSITDVQPEDLDGFDQCHFFAGIGGWGLALRLADWPDDKPVWTGSCPCQPLSCAGQQKGHADERHLWPAFHRLIAQRQPATVFGEQVASKDGREWFAAVRADVEVLGYASGSADLCAAGVGAPHIRQRLFWVAYAHDALGREVNISGEDGRKRQNFGRKEAHRDAGSCGEIRRLAYAHQHGCYSPSIDRGETGQCDAEPRCGVCGVGNTASQGFSERSGKAFHGETACGFGERSSDAGIVGDSSGAGLEGFAGHGRSGAGWPRPSGPIAAPSAHGDAAKTNIGWNLADWLFCRDGKWRPVEPGTFPLADGLPARVGRLRGYGNAINPILAAEFIKSCEEAISDLRSGRG